MIVHRAAERRILNSDEIIRAFSRPPLGVKAQLVDFGGLTMREQVRLMGRTRYLLGVQGAGMSNALFLPDSATVLLLKPMLYSGMYLDGACPRRPRASGSVTRERDTPRSPATHD